MNAKRVGSDARQRLYLSTTDTYDSDRDLDYIAIERVLNGEPTPLTIAEKAYAAQVLDARGYTLSDIGRRIGSDHSTVRVWKANGWQPGKNAPAAVTSRQEPPKCGEPRMYRRHLALGEVPCTACRAANAAADRRYRLTGSRTAPAA
ncbi:helix-turn-helix domain-containing protein [Streptomyces zaomyceticus]|uniref:helix-turn-helix domain-containing protein n=1 Tax=Streptomyces zaomyceticus TaxID=68286 RepID=UPI0033A2CA41